MRTKGRTTGEHLFEEYLESQSIADFDYEKDHGGKSKHPDYVVRVNDKEYIFEVKEFAALDEVITGFYDPFRQIREKINQASKQFKEFKGRPCCLVLYNNKNPLVHLEDAFDMLGAMYGDTGMAFEFYPEKGFGDLGTARCVFLGGGKMIRPNWYKPQNTTISALITLRHKGERHLGVMIYENAFARIPFPRELFCGPYDERYGADGNVVKRVFAGEGILAYENLEEELNGSRTRA